MLISSILLFAYTGASGTSVSMTSIPAASWWAIAYLVVFGSVFTFIAFIYALQHLPAEVNSIYAYINPIVAVILGAIIYNEAFTTMIILGGCVTLIGLYLVNKSMRENKKRRHYDAFS
jgi:drug/metabolite transporter (DMT)-like permease